MGSLLPTCVAWPSSHRTRVVIAVVLVLAIGFLLNSYLLNTYPFRNTTLVHTEEMEYQRNQGHCGPVVMNWDLPIVALASFPRSGNTMTRHLLETGSGFVTGSVYNDERLWNAGLRGENMVRGTIAVKTHTMSTDLYSIIWKSPPASLVYPASKMILLVRLPFDSLWSYFALRSTNNLTQTLDLYDIKQWEQHVINQGLFWRTFHEFWVATHTKRGFPMHVVRYEDIRSDPCNELWKMLDFVLPNHYNQSSCTNLEEDQGTYEFNRLKCASRQGSKCDAAKSCRQGTIATSINRFSVAQIEFVCGTLGDYMQLFGYPIPKLCGQLIPNNNTNKLSTSILNLSPLLPKLDLNVDV